MLFSIMENGVNITENVQNFQCKLSENIVSAVTIKVFFFFFSKIFSKFTFQGCGILSQND